MWTSAPPVTVDIGALSGDIGAVCTDDIGAATTDGQGTGPCPGMSENSQICPIKIALIYSSQTGRKYF